MLTSQDFINYERDVREARLAFPDMEMGAAYDKFMREIKKQEPRPRLSTGDPILKAAKAAIKQTFKRPCTQPRCKGTQILSGVCEGCAAGKKGFKSQWECEECLVREYSTRPFLEWYAELEKMNGNIKD